MKEKLNAILESAKLEIASSVTLKDLSDVKVKFLGKNGEVTELMKGMRDAILGDYLQDYTQEFYNKYGKF